MSPEIKLRYQLPDLVGHTLLHLMYIMNTYSANNNHDLKVHLANAEYDILTRTKAFPDPDYVFKQGEEFQFHKNQLAKALVILETINHLGKNGNQEANIIWHFQSHEDLIICSFALLGQNPQIETNKLNLEHLVVHHEAAFSYQINPFQTLLSNLEKKVWPTRHPRPELRYLHTQTLKIWKAK